MAPERLAATELDRRPSPPTADARVLALISRDLDADLSDPERADLGRVLATDQRAEAALRQLRQARRWLVAARALPAPDAGAQLYRRLWQYLSSFPRRRVGRDVAGRLAPQFAADFRLAQDAAQGDRAAWETLFQTLAPALSALVHQYGFENEHEDIVQDIFLLLWRRIGTFRGDSTLKTWVFRVAINFLHNYRRRVHAKHSREVPESSLSSSAVRRSALVEVAGDQDLDPDRQLERKTLREAVHAALGTLPKARKIAVVLRDLQELSYQEVARILGIPEGTVKSRVARGRMALAAILLANGML